MANNIDPVILQLLNKMMCSRYPARKDEFSFECRLWLVKREFPDGLKEGEDGVGGRGEAKLPRGRHIVLLGYQIQAQAPKTTILNLLLKGTVAPDFVGVFCWPAWICLGEKRNLY